MPDDEMKLRKEDRIVDSSSTVNNVEKLKEGIINLKNETTSLNDIPEDIQVLKDNFLTGKIDWERSKVLRTKEIWFSFDLSAKEKERWMFNGIPKLSGLLAYLRDEYGGIENFDLVS